MRKVERFDMRGNTWPSEDGEIVSYKDYAALEKERDAECENWQKQCADLQKKLDAAEAKLAELHKQEPVLFRDSQGCFVSKGKGEQLIKSGEFVTPYYLRPAPAINLAELVPDEIYIHSEMDFLRKEKAKSHNKFRAEMVRKIEEQIK